MDPRPHITRRTHLTDTLSRCPLSCPHYWELCCNVFCFFAPDVVCKHCVHCWYFSKIPLVAPGMCGCGPGAWTLLLHVLASVIPNIVIVCCNVSSQLNACQISAAPHVYVYRIRPTWDVYRINPKSQQSHCVQRSIKYPALHSRAALTYQY
ncbi:hypothetical protein GDO81_020764 [Engystomops pustulosus]|uniref:Uncharacterized protein n=1 Tax=Engystomops pustulosus TaxID=76066 RepID=A0AAV6YQ48_ENGPU|nr:hypothetical protein GDO81_020764 [Engystomops pustulosus]